MRFNNLEPSPWSDEGAVPGIQQESYDWILEQLYHRRSKLPKLSDRQRAVLVEMMYAAMDYGWESSAANARFRAVRKATAKRSASADAKRATILATHDRMARAGDVTMQAVADACGVHVATVYRAMNSKKPKRRR